MIRVKAQGFDKFIQQCNLSKTGRICKPGLCTIYIFRGLRLIPLSRSFKAISENIWGQYLLSIFVHTKTTTIVCENQLLFKVKNNKEKASKGSIDTLRNFVHPITFWRSSVWATYVRASRRHIKYHAIDQLLNYKYTGGPSGQPSVWLYGETLSHIVPWSLLLRW